MDILFLNIPNEGAPLSGAAVADEADVGVLLCELQDTLRQLRQALHSAMLGSRSGSKEARQWLINSIAGLELADPATKRRRFTQYLPGAAACRGAEHMALAHALLQLLMETAPTEVGAILAQDGSLLRRFFQAEPSRVPLWFGHFSMEGMRRFKFGASALAQYALTNRAEMWDLLAWQGRHSQAPVSVAQRTHYFCELDVARTVRHLIRDCPAFWTSCEMRRSVETGAPQLLAIDPAFWKKELLRWLEDRQRSSQGAQLYDLLCRCLETGSWRQHCQMLLHLLPQQDLLLFAQDLLGSSSFPYRSGRSLDGCRGGSTGASIGAAADGPGSAAEEAGAAAAAGAGAAGAAVAAAPAQPGAWLVFRDVAWQTLDQLLLAAALGCSLPLLLRLLHDEEMAGERQEVLQLVKQLFQWHRPAGRQAAAAGAHWRLREQLRQQQQPGQRRDQPRQLAGAAGVADAGAAAAAAAGDLHEFLLLHLFASAFLVQQLSGSSDLADAQQLQHLLTASGFVCRLQDPPAPQVAVQRSGRNKRKERRRHKSKSRKGKQKKRRHQRRIDTGSELEGSSSSGGKSSGESDAEAEIRLGRSLLDGGDWRAHDDAWVAGGQAARQHHTWQLGSEPHIAGFSSGGSVGPTVSSLELLDVVINDVASAHAAWLFG